MKQARSGAGEGLDLKALEGWIGRRETAQDEVTLATVQRLAATLDKPSPCSEKGQPLPSGWHSTLFPRVAPRAQLGRDGHPALGDFLPPVPLPRRMFAGRRVRFEADLLVGDAVVRTSEIAAIAQKQGRSGLMVFVTIRHSIESPRGLALVEEQDIVYREEAPTPAADAPPPPPPPPPSARLEAPWSRRTSADEVTLFRYSALTFNGHRIHYDQPYVTQVEGYPALVMNGGLTTLYLSELLRESSPVPLRYMETRNRRPLFVGQTLHLCAEPGADGTTARVWVANGEGELILEGNAGFGA